jgi:hypothetical protein
MLALVVSSEPVLETYLDVTDVGRRTENSDFDISTGREVSGFTR